MIHRASSARAIAVAWFVVASTAGAAPPEIILWPDGVPEPRVPADPAETVVKGKDGISRRSNVSNPRLVVYGPGHRAGPR